MKKILLILLSVFSFATIHADITWTLSDDGTLTISGTDMPDYWYSEQGNYLSPPWYFQRDKIKKVVIDNGVTNIGDEAFCNCTSITSVVIPNSVKSIGHEAFYNCTGLTSVTLGNSVTSIGAYAFYWCLNLTSITLPNSVTSIGEYAFCSCMSLTSIAIPNLVTSIGDKAFQSCALSSIVIPKSLTNIGNDAFFDTPYLVSIIVEKGNIKYDSRDNCNAIIETESNTLIRGCCLTIIPNSVTSIGKRAFSNCKMGTSSFSIPNSVTTIGDEAFYGCDDLTTITIPNSVKKIGENAFYGYFTSITCEANTPPDCSSNSFNCIDKTIPVYVPANSVAQYKVANGWKEFTNIQELPTKYTLTDVEIFNNGLQLDGCEISYTRTFNNTSWQALYIPFSLNYEDWKDNFEVAFINGLRQFDKDDDGIIDETIMDVIKIKNGSLIPNTPYLIKAKKTGEKTITVKNATLYKAERTSVSCSTMLAEYTFTGSYNWIHASTLIANEYYAMGSGSLIITDGNSNLNPYRWYMKIDSRSPMYNVSNGTKTITINVVGEEETTGVEEIHIAYDKSSVYDLNGRKVSESILKPGLYIKNGKKVVIN